MSLVIGLVDNGHIWMAGDGIAVWGCVTVRDVLKVRRYFDGALLVGTTGTHRLNNLVLDVYRPPSPESAMPLDAALSFADGLRTLCKEQGVVLTGKEGQEDMSGRVLLGIAGRLFEVSSDFSVVEHASWWAIGCGCEMAQGALAVLDRTVPLEPRATLMLVLETVATYDIHVGPPFTVSCSSNGADRRQSRPLVAEAEEFADA